LICRAFFFPQLKLARLFGYESGTSLLAYNVSRTPISSSAETRWPPRRPRRRGGRDDSVIVGEWPACRAISTTFAPSARRSETNEWRRSYGRTGEQVGEIASGATIRTDQGEPVRNPRPLDRCLRAPRRQITVSHLHGHGHATLPVEYVKNHVRLGYAATAHGHQTDTARRGTTHRADRRGREGPPPGGARRERAEDQGPVRPPVPRTAGPDDRARCQDRASWARTLRTARRSVRRSVDARAARIADSARLLRSRQPTRSRWLLRPERHHGDTPSSILRAW
jgi:hypothetical protein